MDKMQKLKNMMKKEKGFTLVELLAVIVILAIILAIAVPSIGNIISNSKDDADKANQELFENAARLAHVSGDFDGEEITLNTLVELGYLEGIPEDPTSDSEGEEAQYSGGSVVKKEEDPDNANKISFTYDDSGAGEGNTDAGTGTED